MTAEVDEHEPLPVLRRRLLLAGTVQFGLGVVLMRSPPPSPPSGW